MKASTTSRGRLARVLSGLLLAAVAAACGPQIVKLSIRFPSTPTFLVARSMRIRVYPLDETSCASLVSIVANNRSPETEPLYALDGIPTCDVRAGATLPDPGEGRHAFLVEGLDLTGNQTILAGCTEAEVFSGARLSVDLFPTSRYDAAAIADPPGAVTPEQRCGGAP